VVQIATSDTDPSVRAQAGAALARTGALTEPVATTLVQIATSDTHPSVRAQAGTALARTGALTEPVASALVQIATSDAGFMERVEAIEALRQAMPTPDLRKALVGLFRDDDNDVRSATAATLVELSRQHPERAGEIRADLAAACRDPALAERDLYENRTGWDYAYDGLKAHVEALGHIRI
ncbi:HEAT repeat domain-containing protein, partial [Micromonospora chalcea]